MANFPNVEEEKCNFGPWEIVAKKGPILRSNESERIAADLELPQIPEMVFGESTLKIFNKEKQFSIKFSPVDALRLVDNKHDLIKVACAEDWQRERANYDFASNIHNPYDWTYTTAYKGTIYDESIVTVSRTDERIDLEKLKERERILFFTDLLLFEDELGDNGISKLNVKMRVMPSSFFILLRFFLRVDDVIIRINDTRIYHEAGKNYMIREYRSKEKKINELSNPLLEENILVDQLDCVEEEFSKIEFVPSVER